MEHDSFDAFFAERARAAEAYVKGNGRLLDQLVTHQGDATFFSPQGDVATGAEFFLAATPDGSFGRKGSQRS